MGAKSNPFSHTFISVFVGIIRLRLKTVLEQKTRLSRPSSIKFILLIEGSSVVIEVVLEDPTWFGIIHNIAISIDTRDINLSFS